MRRVCPWCLATLTDDPRRDRVVCRVHGVLTAWIVMDARGRLLGAGRASTHHQEGAVWLAPRLVLEPQAAA